MKEIFNILGFFFRFFLGCRDQEEGAAERRRGIYERQLEYERRRYTKDELEYQRLGQNDPKASPFRDFPKEKAPSTFRQRGLS